MFLRKIKIKNIFGNLLHYRIIHSVLDKESKLYKYLETELNVMDKDNFSHPNILSAIDMINIFYDGTVYYAALTTGYA
jgi:hypothetical protein